MGVISAVDGCKEEEEETAVVVAVAEAAAVREEEENFPSFTNEDTSWQKQRTKNYTGLQMQLGKEGKRNNLTFYVCLCLSFLITLTYAVESLQVAATGLFSPWATRCPSVVVAKAVIEGRHKVLSHTGARKV